MGDKRYRAPELAPENEARKAEYLDAERHTATFWLPISIAAGLMVVIVVLFVSVAA